MEIHDLEHLKYPVGRYTRPEEITPSMFSSALYHLEQLPDQLAAEYERLSNNHLLDTSYRSGGWTAKQVIHHLADSHMNALVRIKLALTEDNPVIKPYDENAWAKLYDSVYVDPLESVNMVKAIHAKLVALAIVFEKSDRQRSFFHPEQNRKISVAECYCMYGWHSRTHLGHLKLIQATAQQ